MIDWFEADLDKAPEDWDTRLRYAVWLEENRLIPEAKVQRWLAEHQKCPGPGCVQEAECFEASWFIESHAGHKWGFAPSSAYYGHGVIEAEWCLPTAMFVGLKNFITHRRDAQYGNKTGVGFHNRFAKSWKGRRQAEAALVEYARGEPILHRTLDAAWGEQEYDIPAEFKYD